MSEISPFAHLTNEELRQELSKNGIIYGPIIASTRKVYEKKLQNNLEGRDMESILSNGTNENDNHEVARNGGSRASSVMNGNGGGSRETSPAIIVQSQQGNGPTKDGVMDRRETTPKLAADDDSDNEEDTSESARILTPDEVHSFRSGLISRYTESTSKNGSANVRLRREASFQPTAENNGSLVGNGRSDIAPIAGNQSKIKRFGLPILVMLFVLGTLIAAAIQFRGQLMAFIPALQLPTAGKGNNIIEGQQDEKQQPAILED